MFLRTSAAFSDPNERRQDAIAMYEEGFDIDAVRSRLAVTYPVEPYLPFQIRLMLLHLARAEAE